MEAAEPRAAQGTYDAASFYRIVDGWGRRLPVGLEIGDVGGIGVDEEDNVYVFHRGRHPMIVLDRQGTFLRSWGEGYFVTPHGVSMGPDRSIYLTDIGRHTVTKCSLDGEVLLELGIPGVEARYMSGLPFNRCTHTAIAANGDIFVSDGYGNARVHRFSATGEHLLSWGVSGCEPGEFNIPHNLVCGANGRVYVADRENHRIQVFTEDGEYLEQWNNLHRPCALAYDPARALFYVGEAGPGMPVNVTAPNLGQRVLVFDADGAKVGTYGSGRFGIRADDFVAAHAIACDSEGSLYIGEVTNIAWPDYNGGSNPDGPLRTIRKIRVA